MLLGEHPNLSQLKSFTIDGLFGFKDIKIPFDKEALILIAENGSGKTTILNALYYSLTCNFYQLSTIVFDSVILEFASGVTVEIKKSDLKSFFNYEDSKAIALLRQYLPNQEIELLQRKFRKGSLDDSYRRWLLNISTKYPIQVKYFDSLIEAESRLTINKATDRKSKIDKIKATIQENLNESIPTLSLCIVKYIVDSSLRSE